jgi:hypothetical protein
MWVRLWEVLMRILLVVGGKSPGIEHDRQLGRKLGEMTVRGGEAGLRKERNKELTSKRVSIDLTPLSKTHKLAIDLRSPITANSPPDPPFHLQTATHKMSTEHSRSTSAAGPSGRTTSSSAGPSSQAGSSTSAGPAANASPNHAHNQRQFIGSLALAIAMEKKQMPLPANLGAPVFGGADVTKFIEAYKSLCSRTGTDPAAEDVIATFPYYCSEMILETIEMMNGYLTKDWVQLEEELKDAFRHADSQVYMYSTLYLERLCRDQLERGNVGLNAFILA